MISTVDLASRPGRYRSRSDLVSRMNAQYWTRRVTNYELSGVGQIPISAGTQRRRDRDQVGLVTTGMLDDRFADSSRQRAETLKAFRGFRFLEESVERCGAAVSRLFVAFTEDAEYFKLCFSAAGNRRCDRQNLFRLL